MSFHRMSNMAGTSKSSSRILTMDEVIRMAPSVAATEAHSSRSERYAYIPTVSVLEGLMAEGFLPVLAKQGNTRVPGKEDFTKHLVRLRHSSDQFERGGKVREVVLVNSHDGTSAYQLSAGLMRVACLNGLVVSESYKSVKVPHKGDVRNLVIEGAFEVLGETSRAMEAATNWGQIAMSRDESMALAESVHMVRFPARPEETEAERLARIPIEPARMLRPVRSEDQTSDLWTITNVIQEHAIRGGQQGRVQGSDGRTRRARTRSVEGIDQSLAINRAIWALTERMAQLKNAA